METFLWDDVGVCNGLEIIEVCNTLKTNYTAGYMATRARNTKMQKRFDITWESMTRPQWKKMIEFWRSVYGSADAFLWPFPTGVYNFGGYSGDGDPPDGFDDETDTGYGQGPVFIVRFVEATMPQRAKVGGIYWRVTASVQEVS